MVNTPFDTQSQSAGRASGPRAAMLDDEEGGLDIRRYLTALYRHKWMILGLGATGLALGFAASRFIEPQYEAVVSMQVDLITRSAQQTTPIRTTQLMETPRGWTDLLRSYSVLDEVVSRRRLFIETDIAAEARYFENFAIAERFTPGHYEVITSASGDRVKLTNEADAVLDDRPMGDSLGLALGMRWVPTGLPPGSVVGFRLRAPRDAAVRLRSAMNAPPLTPENTFLTVSLRGPDPAATAATLNALADRYIEYATFLKRDKLSQSTNALQQQLDLAQAELRAADNELETFRVNTITLGSDQAGGGLASGTAATRDPVQQAYFRARLERDSLVVEREALERALQAAPDTNMTILIRLGAIPSARSNSELSTALQLLSDKRAEARQMRLSFGPLHEPLRQLDREVAELETTTIPNTTRAVIANLASRVRELDQRITTSGRDMQAIPQRLSEEARLQRNVQVKTVLYTQLQAALEQAKLAELATGADVRLLDPARAPSVPVADQVQFIILGGLLGGLGLGIAITLLLDRFDKRIRHPDQVTKDLGLTILGTLPLMKSRKGIVDPEYASQLLESMRGIRTNLNYAHGTAGPFVTAITSPGPGDGKSFTSANLARAFAASGVRTILVDADTRRGLQHRNFGLDRRPGLIDFLDGSATQSEVTKHIADTGIDFVPCGTRRAGGPELLASPAMSQFIMGLRTQYQAIIVDCPPLGAGVDPLVLASLTGSMVIVIRTGVTDRDMAGARLADLSRLPIRLLGAILNDVSATGAYKYYGYLPGYRAEDEGPEDEPRVHTPASRMSQKKLKG
jgi:succinoglycan biosynthesis transport protein ExoP